LKGFGDDVEKAIAAAVDKENGRTTEDTSKLETREIFFANENAYKEFIAKSLTGDIETMNTIITMMDDPEISFNFNKGRTKRHSSKGNNHNLSTGDKEDVATHMTSD